MINKIKLHNISSYKTPAVLETDKKINLIYGLNGTGKSTFSDYLLKITDPKYKDCCVESVSSDEEILVYNQTFIREVFYESEKIGGIFTLSKENKEAEIEIAIAEKELKRLEAEKAKKETDLQKEESDYELKLDAAKDKIWEIKRNFTGGDRVLEYCLEGYKNDRTKLFSYVEKQNKPDIKPIKTIELIKEEVQTLTDKDAKKYVQLEFINFSGYNIETSTIFKKQIVGNENSTVSELINRFGSSDWVKDGLKYLPIEIEKEREICPFCQQPTISKDLFRCIKEYFDASYDADINEIKTLYTSYSNAVQAIPQKTIYESNPKYEPYKKDFELKYDALLKVVDNNLRLIEEKLISPSVSVSLRSSVGELEELNDIILNINKLITEHNIKLDRKEIALEECKSAFWNIMRWDYDQTISTYQSNKTLSERNTLEINKTIQVINNKIKEQRNIIIEQQNKTVNIEEAITNINNGLLELGFEEFKIKHHSTNYYKIVREQNDNQIFHSLSEGEKMIISFLYFMELCKGKKDATEAGKKKIIVIDDPISSLSHIYVFNIGRFIKDEFYGKKETKEGELIWTYKYEQVFILTHSLYFFYEMTEINHDDRPKTQKLFRLTKNETGSHFCKLKYEEIKNDYHAYWSIIKDPEQNPALIANCMRNIIEYFFGFMENKNLSVYFDKDEMKTNRFQAFYRFINRESHSIGQNIFDYKEFNYEEFRDAFETLFIIAGYHEHYKKMMK